MDTEEQFGQMASLLGEPARAKILWALLDGKAFTATELAWRAEVSPQSASMHLGKLVQAGWLSVEHQGRHRYYQLATREVAYAIEAIANLLPADKRDPIAAPLSNGHIKYCRSCYDHLAGRTGVAVTDAMLRKNLLQLADGRFEVTGAGVKWLAALEIDVEELKSLRRAFAKPCLDWSERRHHLAGSLGAALLEKMLADDWLRRVRHSRAIVVTAKGEKKFSQLLGLTI
jgi:DNA-binding transcriptional ArsR family regulator